MSRLPDWVLKLPQPRRCGAEAVGADNWQVSVPEFCAEFQSIYTHRASDPARTTALRKASWNDNYGKPLLKANDPGVRSIGEYEVVRAFRDAGWDAYWTDAFGSARPWMRVWKEPLSPPPQRLARLLEQIRTLDSRSRPWDVVAWRGRFWRFVEYKETDGFTDGQRRFVLAAHRIGVDLRSFAAVRGTVVYPGDTG